MVDQGQERTSASTSTSSMTATKLEEDSIDSDSDTDSNSSVVTVVHSPLSEPSSAILKQPSSAPAAKKKASEALTSSSSFEVRPPATSASISTPVATARRGSTVSKSPESPSSSDSYFAGLGFDLRSVQNSAVFATASPVPLPVLGPQSPPQRQAPASIEQFPTFESQPIRPRPLPNQSFEPLPRRHRATSFAGIDPGIGGPPQSQPPPILQNRSSHFRSTSNSSTFVSGTPRDRSTTSTQHTNYSLPLPRVGEGSEPFPKLSSTASSHTPSVQDPTASPLAERRRTRGRSNAIRGENPLDVPITAPEYQLANLVRTINQENEKEAGETARRAAREAEVRASLQLSGGYTGGTFDRRPAPLPRSQTHRAATFSSRQPLPTPIEDPIDRSTTPTPRDYAAGPTSPQTTQFSPLETPRLSSGQFTRASALRSDIRQPNIRISGRTSSIPVPKSAPLATPLAEPSTGAPKTRANTLGFGDLQIWRIELPEVPTSVFESLFGDQERSFKSAITTKKMNFQSYGDSAQSGPSNPRQAPPSPSQGMNHQNGVNGGMNPGTALIGYPTPAGHQSDLNYVMSMVDELAGVLRMNQQLTANVVDKMGRVREKAKHLSLNNDELMAAAAGEMNDEGQNLDKEVSDLRKALEDAQYNRHENFKLAVHGAEILNDIAEKVHKFKATHEADTLAWHKNYRKQLADEREENLRLRNEMNDLKAGACRANGHIRDMRRYLTDNDERHELRVENHRLRTEKRFWKRLALPLIPDDDSEWSDDDDLIDSEEKKRLEAALREKERLAKEELDGEPGVGSA
ncbi:hypothetical protein LSUE1_G003117 [Lachnellula suecica]|uniref:Uncharacterized protein n=1 Tax=Lachnellula suecica TaxID=602035 RepID=A0A8T9CDM0_9HELO|nr:hypothetical protein LSUE1_G003117 [Lachnellula suecica]